MGERRVVMVCFHPAAPGQAAGTHVSEIARALGDVGWKVTVVRPTDEVGHHRSMAHRVLGWLGVLRRAAAGLRHVDAVYIRSHPAGLPLAALARWLRLTVAQEVNGPHEDYVQAWPMLARARWLVTVPVERQLRRADAVIAVTHGLAGWVERVAQRAAAVVPNGVDTERFRPGLLPHPTVGSRPYVAFVGALAPWQGVPALLAAAQHPNWPHGVALVIAGEGSERQLVIRAVEAGPDRVVWLGQVPNEEVPNLLANAIACAVTSSDRNGTGVSPLKLYEAMAAGVPVIVPEVAGSSATVRAADGGLVVPRGDPGALAAAVARLAADPDLRRRLGGNARAAAVDEHSWTRRGSATADVLADAVTRGGRR